MPLDLTRPLPADFADRLEALCDKAAALGHTDVAYVLEMVIAIAKPRIAAQASTASPVLVDAAVLAASPLDA